ncbi:hypothetical protein JZX87_28340 [Agrobacterium sp. Ap1]|jgi:ABC-type methionine transport system permease subunit|nr:hypothetical protein [Agrobacterium sp. Ap1]
MSDVLIDLFISAIVETLMMTFASGLISLAIGLPLGLALVATARGGRLTLSPTISAAWSSPNSGRALPQKE